MEPNILQEVQLPVVNFADCNRTIVQLGPEAYLDNATHLCAGYGSISNKSGCSGDSGGPFSCYENGRYSNNNSIIVYFFYKS